MILFRSRDTEITVHIVVACIVSGVHFQPFNLSEEFLATTPKRDNRYRKLERILKGNRVANERKSPGTPGVLLVVKSTIASPDGHFSCCTQSSTVHRREAYGAEKEREKERERTRLRIYPRSFFAQTALKRAARD